MPKSNIDVKKDYTLDPDVVRSVFQKNCDSTNIREHMTGPGEIGNSSPLGFAKKVLKSVGRFI